MIIQVLTMVFHRAASVQRVNRAAVGPLLHLLRQAVLTVRYLYDAYRRALKGEINL